MLLWIPLATATTTVRFVEENDWFAPQIPLSDRWYTQGMRVHVTHEAERIWAVGLGQELYTPRGVYAKFLRFRERPFAGWLSVNGAVAWDEGDRLTTLRLDVGGVGPWTMAGRGQAALHAITPATQAVNGWTHELHNEFHVNARADRAWRFEWDTGALIGGIGGSAGTAWTQVDAGAMVQLGHAVGWGPPSIKRWRVQPSAQDGAAAILATDVWLTGWDVTLDGNRSGDSHSIPRIPLVGEFRTGVELSRGRWSGSYTYTIRSLEFVGQERTQRYGTVTLARQL